MQFCNCILYRSLRQMEKVRSHRHRKKAKKKLLEKTFSSPFVVFSYKLVIAFNAWRRPSCRNIERSRENFTNLLSGAKQEWRQRRWGVGRTRETSKHIIKWNNAQLKKAFSTRHFRSATNNQYRHHLECFLTPFRHPLLSPCLQQTIMYFNYLACHTI